MEIAGSVICVHPLFESTKEYCRPYLAQKVPDFTVYITPEDCAREQKLLDQEAVEQGLKFRKFKEPFLERSVIQRRVADFLVERDTLLLHGSTVAVDGRAYLFTAPCGTGKSTHTRLWREVFGQRAVMVNDDKPFLKITPDGVLAYGSPWSGKHGLASNVCVPLQGICSLERGKENRIHRTDANQLLDILRSQVHTPEDPVMIRKVYALLDSLAERVALWVMQCNMDPEAARISHSVMSCD
jgi:hypothetical protein